MKKFKPNMSYDNYVFFCDICGRRSNITESYELENETGHGGALVCTRGSCLDNIVYGLIPYEIEAEESPDIVRVDASQSVTEAALDISGLDPMQPFPATRLNWEDITANWEDIYATWDGDQS